MTLDAQTIVIILVVGLVAGWLASFVVGGSGPLRYLVTGLLGAILGSYLFSVLNIRMPIGTRSSRRSLSRRSGRSFLSSSRA